MTVFTCDDLRLGGTLSDAGITGGLSINGTALSVADWSGILGHAGYRKTPVAVSGRAGARIVGEGLPKERYFNLLLNVGRLSPAGTLLSPTPEEQLVANTDQFMALIADPDGQYLEVDMPDGSSRYLFVYSPDPGFVNQPRRLRTLDIPLQADWGYWRASLPTTDSVNGSDSWTGGGTVNIYDPVFTFDGDGSLTNTTAGWTLTITGASGPVVVDVGARTVFEGSTRSDNLLTITDRAWGWLVPGTNAMTSTVNVSAKWRAQYP
jgi:hypothetical protein